MIDPIRFRRARKLVNELTHRGIVLELTQDGKDFDVLSYALDNTGEYIPIPPTVLEEIEADRELILEELRHWERSVDIVTRIWLKHDPEYRAEHHHPSPLGSPAGGNERRITPCKTITITTAIFQDRN